MNCHPPRQRALTRNQDSQRYEQNNPDWLQSSRLSGQRGWRSGNRPRRAPVPELNLRLKSLRAIYISSTHCQAQLDIGASSPVDGDCRSLR